MHQGFARSVGLSFAFFATVATACVGEDASSPQPNNAATDAGPAEDAQHTGPGADGQAIADALAVEANPSPCDLGADFGTPSVVAGLENAAADGIARLSEDELTVFFGSFREGAPSVFTAKRPSIAEPFAGIERVRFGDGDAGAVFAPSINGNASQIYLSRNKENQAEHDIGFAMLVGGTFGPIADVVGDVNTRQEGAAIQHESDPFVLPDGSAIYFIKETTLNFFEIHRAPCAEPGRCTGTKKHPEISIQRGFGSVHPVVSADELTIFFAAPPDAAGAKGTDIYVATRDRKSEEFRPPKRVYGALELDEHPSFISKDNCRLYFESDATGNYEIYVMARPPG